MSHHRITIVEQGYELDQYTALSNDFLSINTLFNSTKDFYFDNYHVIVAFTIFLRVTVNKKARVYDRAKHVTVTELLRNSALKEPRVAALRNIGMVTHSVNHSLTHSHSLSLTHSHSQSQSPSHSQ